MLNSSSLLYFFRKMYALCTNFRKIKYAISSSFIYLYTVAKIHPRPSLSLSLTTVLIFFIAFYFSLSLFNNYIFFILFSFSNKIYKYIIFFCSVPFFILFNVCIEVYIFYSGYLVSLIYYELRGFKRKQRKLFI